jgi:hypothetical protein
MPIDLQRVSADQVRGDALMDVGFDRASAEERFAETDESFVGVNLHPKQVGKFIEPKRFNPCDLQLPTLVIACDRLHPCYR